MHKPIVLIVRDGWGIGPEGPGNAVRAARKPYTDRLLAEHPNCTLDASGEPVGVRPGSQGSSEVGHLNMGAGRIVDQEVVRVDRMIANGELFRIPRLLEAVERCRSNGSKFHLMGLVQDQGVHATQEHLFAFLDFLAGRGLTDVCVHFFGDGRDTPPRSALTYLDALERQIAACGAGRVASVMGRYWAMDRALNWDRTEKAYRALVCGEGLTAPSAAEAIEAAYKRADAQLHNGDRDDDIVETDEFIRPTLITGPDGRPVGLIESGDVVLHTNYRQDRAIQLTKAFVEPGFDEFPRDESLDITYLGLTRYYDEFPFELLEPMNMANLLGKVLADNGLRQLRIAEAQKYKHVTSFFNGKLLEPMDGEDRIMVDSITIPEDQKPEMSAYEVTDLALKAVNEGVAAVRQGATDMPNAHPELGDPLENPADPDGDAYDVIVLNYANGDMVGHTGVLAAATKAIEVVDECVGKVVNAVVAKGGAALVTADHGNAEQMTDPDSGAVRTAHTLSPVEFILVADDSSRYDLVDHGKLSDVAVTILDLLNIPTPPEMTAASLIVQDDSIADCGLRIADSAPTQIPHDKKTPPAR